MTAANLIVLPLAAVLALSACKSDGTATVTDQDGTSGTTASAPVTAQQAPSDLLGGWFVREFDPRAVEQIRNSVAFVAQNIRYVVIPPRGSEVEHDREMSSNAYRDIGLDYARSVGLTGKGVTVSVVDSPINLQHADFAGKKVISADTPAVSGQGNHGTGVAGVAVGKNGVAPRARLHHAAISFDGDTKLSTLAAIMRDAADQGALISNNSWAMTATVEGNRTSSLLSEYQAGRDYLDSLRDFTANGIVVFAVTNDYSDTSAHLMAGLPALYPELEQGWLAVINAIPQRRGDRIESAIRVSAACLEAARWCIAANGHVNAPSSFDLEKYGIAKGASYAAPQISGALALLAEAFPDLTAAELRARLLVTADNSFFVPDGFVEFAPGLSHGYSDEWGHGFADLRAALLPIGRMTTPTASGSPVAMDEAVVVAGTAMGDGVAQRLNATQMVINDQMQGSFAVPAGSIVQTRAQPKAEALSTRMARTNLPAMRAAARMAAGGNVAAALNLPGAMTQSGSYSIEQGYDVSLAQTGQYRLSAILSRGSGSNLGLAGARVFAGERAGLELGFEAIHEADSVIGMQAARSGGSSHHVALTAQAAFMLGDQAVLRVGGKIGRASGGTVGRMIEVGSQTFDSLSTSLSFASPARKGDVLTFFANQPVAVRSGSAMVSLAQSTAAGGVDFSRLVVDTAPTTRQIDLGMEYLTPVAGGADLALAATHILSAGNIAGRTDTQIGIRIDWQF